MDDFVDRLNIVVYNKRMNGVQVKQIFEYIFCEDQTGESVCDLKDI